MATARTSTERVTKLVPQVTTEPVITLTLDKNEAEAIAYYFARSMADWGDTRESVRARVASGTLAYTSLTASAERVLTALDSAGVQWS